MSRSPHDLLVERHKAYRQAFERVQRAVEARHRAQERLQELERKLAAADPPTFRSTVLSWRQGDEILLGRDKRRRVLGIRDDDADQPPVLVVEDSSKTDTDERVA